MNFSILSQKKCLSVYSHQTKVAKRHAKREGRQLKECDALDHLPVGAGTRRT